MNVDRSACSRFAGAGVHLCFVVQQHGGCGTKYEHGVLNQPMSWRRMKERKKRRAVRNQRDPRDPTVAERAVHEVTHLPSRSWCAEFVAGRRDNPPHRRVPKTRTKCHKL